MEVRQKIQPFTIQVSQPVLDDLQQRLANTRWPDELKEAGWEYGTNLAWLQQLTSYWQYKYDWKAQEAALNKFKHYKEDVNGFKIHFIYEKSKRDNAIPLLLLHGYPDSFYRMYKLIPLLTDADQSFDVVVPSLPGFGFSDKPSEKGFTLKEVADLFLVLMRDVLGYEKFAVHGGDWGSSITEQMAMYHSEALIGIHMTDIPYWRIFGIKSENLSKPEQEYMEKGKKWGMEEGAYGMILSTKPQTLSYGLNDSPVGLAAWIIEKFQKWSDCNGDVETKFTKDELLTNVMIYWITQTISSSGRYYYESLRHPPQYSKDKIEVPTGAAIFKSTVAAPREFAERFYNIRSWTEMPRGGHFLAMEEPQLLADDIRKFFSSL
jgi:pimeloyl-ACP methyl ester carboxylesterase